MVVAICAQDPVGLLCYARMRRHAGDRKGFPAAQQPRRQVGDMSMNKAWCKNESGKDEVGRLKDSRAKLYLQVNHAKTSF